MVYKISKKGNVKSAMEQENETCGILFTSGSAHEELGKRERRRRRRTRSA